MQRRQPKQFEAGEESRRRRTQKRNEGATRNRGVFREKPIQGTSAASAWGPEGQSQATVQAVGQAVGHSAEKPIGQASIQMMGPPAASLVEQVAAQSVGGVLAQQDALVTFAPLPGCTWVQGNDVPRISLADFSAADFIMSASTEAMPAQATIVPSEVEALTVSTVTVCLRGLPKALCTNSMIDAVIEQACLRDVVVYFRVGMEHRAGEAFLTLVDQHAADKCIWHFHGCEWGEGGKPVTASLFWDDPVGVSDNSAAPGHHEENRGDLIERATDRLLAALLAPSDGPSNGRKKAAPRWSEGRPCPFLEGITSAPLVKTLLEETAGGSSVIAPNAVVDASTEEGVSSAGDSLEGNESVE